MKDTLWWNVFCSDAVRKHMGTHTEDVVLCFFWVGSAQVTIESTEISNDRHLLLNYQTLMDLCMNVLDAAAAPTVFHFVPKDQNYIRKYHIFLDDIIVNTMNLIECGGAGALYSCTKTLRTVSTPFGTATLWMNLLQEKYQSHSMSVKIEESSFNTNFFSRSFEIFSQMRLFKVSLAKQKEINNFCYTLGLYRLGV